MQRSVSFVQAQGQRLEYVEIPAREPERPELLFLHEGLGSVSLWRDFPERLAEATGCRAIVYSRWGFGRSEPRRAPYTERFMHEEAFGFVPEIRARLGIRQPVLVGHSTGASMALLHASRHRDVAGVIAMAPFVFVEDSNVASIAATTARFPELRERLARHHDDVDAMFEGWSALWLDPAFRRWNIEAEAALIRCPILAMVGDRDEYCTRTQLERLAAAATSSPHVEVLYLTDCGHAPHRDQLDIVLGASVHFIQLLGN
ncbi:MAG: alpha/beta fold hydrolase [Bacillota bacterium]